MSARGPDVEGPGMEWFEDAPVALLAVDLAAVRRRLAALRPACDGDLRAYLGDHPDEFAHLAALVEVVAANREAVDFLGRGSLDELRRALPHSLDDRSRPAMAAAAAALDRGDPLLEHEVTIRLPAGEVRVVAVRVRLPAEGEAGRRTTIIALTDVTTQHRAEAAMAESAAQIAAIGNNLPRAMLYQVVRELDGQRRFSYLSEGVRDLFGCAPLDAVADASLVYGRIVEEDRARVKEDEEEAHRQLTPFKTQARVQPPSGRPRWVSFSSTPRLRADGTTVWDGVALDVSETMGAAESLRESEQRLRLAAESTGLGLWENSPRTGTSWWDPRSRELFWFPPEEPISYPRFEERIHPDDRDRVRETFRQSLDPRRDGRYTIEFRLRGPAGEERWIQGSARVLFDGGTATRVIGTALDITARKAEEARLQRLLDETSAADRRKAEFLAMLSHELRNPLAPITSSLYVLERAAAGGDQARRAQAVIGRQVAHLTRLVDDLLDVTRISQGKVQLQRERVELGTVVRRTMDDYRAEFQAREVTLEGRFGSELLWVDADVIRIAQVVGNLLANAAKFTPAGGRVEIILEREGTAAVMQVRDTGIGVPPEVIDDLFQPFAQAPQSLARPLGGLGLGLALVKGLAELHEGSVGVSSAGPGHGTQFTVRLPLAPSAAHDVAAPAPPPPTARPRRVLLIEDNVDAADTLREVLQFGGHEVRVALDGPNGLALAREFRPEVVLCDIGLPGMSGYEVARALRADPSQHDVVLVALTGYALPEDRERAAAAGFAHHVAKPPSLEALEALLATLG